jgi:hypothetical protein
MNTNRKKLRLNIEALKVEVFATQDSTVGRGTVYGRVAAATNDGTCDGGSCSGMHVCLGEVTGPCYC